MNGRGNTKHFHQGDVHSDENSAEIGWKLVDENTNDVHLEGSLVGRTERDVVCVLVCVCVCVRMCVFLCVCLKIQTLT